MGFLKAFFVSKDKKPFTLEKLPKLLYHGLELVKYIVYMIIKKYA